MLENSHFLCKGKSYDVGKDLKCENALPRLIELLDVFKNKL